MEGRILLEEPHITIIHNLENDWLYVNWSSEQTKETVMRGCQQMLEFLKRERIQKVLNDNSQVSTIWSDAAEWGAKVWFPSMYAAGCCYFAWVYSPNIYSKLSTDFTLSFPIPHLIIATFDDIETGKGWLKAV